MSDRDIVRFCQFEMKCNECSIIFHIWTFFFLLCSPSAAVVDHQNTHIDFKVFRCRVDVAGGGVVAWQVVQSHMTYGDGVWQRDDQVALDSVECPTFPWKENRVTLGWKETAGLLATLGKLVFPYKANTEFCTWMTVRGLSDGYQRGKPKRVTHADRMRYVSEHRVLTMLAPSNTHRINKMNKLNENHDMKSNLGLFLSTMTKYISYKQQNVFVTNTTCWTCIITHLRTWRYLQQVLN